MSKYSTPAGFAKKNGVDLDNPAFVQVQFIAEELAAQEYRAAQTDEERKAIAKAAIEAIEKIVAPYRNDAEKHSKLINYAQYAIKKIGQNSFSEEASPPLLLLGFPGHGKTSCLKQAAKAYAEARGLQFLEASNTISPNEIDYEKTYVMCTLELGGQATATAISGLPVYDSEKKELVQKVVNHLEAASRAKHGFLLLDDFANAMPEITSALHQLLIERQSGSINLKGKSIAATGNLGYEDNTAATQLSSAIFGRTIPFYVADDKETFVSRLKSKNPKAADIVQSFFVAFEDTEGILFGAQEVTNSQIARSSSPRSWENAIRGLGSKMFDYVEENETAVRDRIERITKNVLPEEVATKFMDHLDSLRLSIYPIAKAVYEKGQLDEPLKKRYEKTLALHSNDIATKSNRDMLMTYLAQMFLDDYLSSNENDRYQAVKKAMIALSLVEPNQNTVDDFLLAVAAVINDGRMNRSIEKLGPLGEEFFAKDEMCGGYYAKKEMVMDFGNLIRTVIQKEGNEIKNNYKKFDDVVEGLRYRQSPLKPGYMIVSKLASEKMMAKLAEEMATQKNKENELNGPEI